MNSVIIQQLSIVWTKGARGAPAASLRNALPRALPVTPYEAAYLYQRHVFSEADGCYRHRLREDQTGDQVPRTCRDLGLALQDGVLSLRTVWTAHMGQPPRKSSSVVKLAIGESARLRERAPH